MRTLFGFWPLPHSIQAPDWAIEPVPDFDARVSAVVQHPRHWDGWVYPPLKHALPSPSNAQGAPPLVQVDAFALPSTHILTCELESCEVATLDFLIALLGLLEGMRLTRDGWTHFNRAAVSPQKLSDIVCFPSDYERVLSPALAWWLASSPKQRFLVFGAIHWRMFASTYTHMFERFASQYYVLDSLFAAHKLRVGLKGFVAHGTRPSLLAGEYGLVTPAWAVVVNKNCRVAELRNDLVHEARFAGAPIGFAHPRDFPLICLELESFNTRLILAMLGVEAEYVATPCDTRQMHGLGLPPISNRAEQL
jgi:hypothetical protein